MDGPGVLRYPDCGMKEGGALRRRVERGSILVFSLIGMLFLFALVVPFLLRFSGQYRVTEKNFLGLAAMNLAEAGVERAIWELNKGDVTAWTGSLLERRLSLTGVQASGGDAVGDVDIVITSPASDNPVVETTARVPWYGGQTVVRSLRVVLRRGFRSHFDFGIFGDEGLDFHGNAATDSYNSLDGPYDPLLPGDRGSIGTNGVFPQNVLLVNNTTIRGDCLTGFQSDPDVVIVLENNSTITGTRSALDAPKLLPVSPPPLLADRGALSVGHNDEIVITESGRYISFSLSSNSKVTISGNITLYVDGDFTMHSNSVVEIAPGSEVEIVLGNGVFTQESNTEINNLTRDPRRLAVLGTSQFHQMTWRSNSEFYGVVYVPEANVEFYANADFFGSLVANYLHLSSNAGIHYDESLGLWDKYGLSTTEYVVRSWQEKF
jgi:hypothetical protein